jgi:hypothetical protein
MDSISAFGRGEASRGQRSMVFDWVKAARLIRETKPTRARAGLQSDWEWTGGDIYADGEPVPQEATYTYLASTWATPELSMDGADGNVIVDCYVMQDETGWDAGTYWPAEALHVLNGGE